jgi:hypothetical protein
MERDPKEGVSVGLIKCFTERKSLFAEIFMAIVKYFKILEINYTPLYGEEEELRRFPIMME